MKGWCWLLCLLCGIQMGRGQALIPCPVDVKALPQEEYVFGDKVVIALLSEGLENEAEELRQVVKDRTGREPEIVRSGKMPNGAVCLKLDAGLSETERYELTVNSSNVCIAGKTAAGVFYGIQTFDQLLAENGGNTVCTAVGGVRITDSPRFGYRALMLDPARHFIPLEEVKRFIDLMARFKFNVLQLHLTDDQGWRIEIKAYPDLTGKGAYRNPQGGMNGPDNGYYTQEELKELVAYAARKHVEIVPELDIPGHTAAAIHAYPHLGCLRGDSVPLVLGKSTDRMLCAAEEGTYEFYDKVIGEVSRLFPSRRIHLGGDEAVMEKNWGVCPRCRALMERQGFRKTDELMGYFFERIEKTVKRNDKEMLLWCELDNIRMPAERFLFDYPKDCTLFTWRMGLTPRTIELTARAGIKLIASPGEYCYFDYPQWKGDLPEFNNWGMPLLPLRQAYAFDPGYGLPPEEQGHIIGVAGLLWGEAMADMNRITYMAFPRALALAEAGWSRMENRDWESFKNRMYPLLADLMRKGVSFRVPFEVSGSH
ncbi:beta-N-acetylhexosaminidase [Odoribacter lunatus]|uniref:beta-N-acetylhexosaminidase n=1 Tax=Odoribacter lunatus TaxID=2941335 RepID=UPI00203D5110|nr:beta-N-acetylhexosaminidase [Odoribacter lunatus]